MENPYVAYAKRLMLMDRKIPETLCKIKDIAAKRFGAANVSLECGFDSFDYPAYTDAINDEISNALSIITRTGSTWQPTKIKKRPRTVIKELCPIFWTKFAIILRIPDKTVTNEENKKIQIKDLFVRIPLRTDGKLSEKFQYMRTTFTREQYEANYIHSHCTRFERSHVQSWHNVCTGHGPNTPINDTIARLKANSFSQLTWECFFWELEKATGSESLAGGPYIRMSYVNTPLEKITTLQKPEIKPIIDAAKQCGFLRDYIKANLFKVAFINKKITIAESFASWLITLSEFLTKWEEEHNFKLFTIQKGTYIVFNDSIYRKKSINHRSSYSEAGTPMLKFKGKEYKLTITKEQDNSSNEKTLIKPEVGYVLLSTLLNIVNTELSSCEYEKRTEIQERQRREVFDAYYRAKFPITCTENIKFF